MSEVDDRGLLERARRSDELAFSQLFERYQRAVYRYAVQMCGPDAGDDIVQETFMVVLQQGRRDDPPRGPVIGYLLGIARHRAWKRISSSDVAAATGNIEEHGDEFPAPDQITALDALTRAETVATVRAAVQSLPVVYREVVALCELQEMDYAAAAGVMECPIGTVRSRLHRARALLMTKLASMHPGVQVVTE